jgi:hypothetical protein
LEIAREHAPTVLLPQARSTDVDFDVRHGLELAGQRGARIAGTQARVARATGARIAGTQARVARATAGTDDDTRRLLHGVAVAFSRSLAAGERSRLRRRAADVAADLVRIAERAAIRTARSRSSTSTRHASRRRKHGSRRASTMRGRCSTRPTCWRLAAMSDVRRGAP